MKTVMITGATGGLGKALTADFKRHGCKVIRLIRKADCSGDVEFKLSQKDIQWPEVEPTVLIHCAYDFTDKNSNIKKNLNFTGTLNLFHSYRKKYGSSAKFLFISSLAAFAEAKSTYGQVKYQTERELLPQETYVIRVGLIHDTSSGIVPSMKKLAAKFSIIPLINGGRDPVYPVSSNEIYAVIMQILTSGKPAADKVILFLPNEAVTFRKFFNDWIGTKGVRYLIVPVYWKILWYCAQILECVNLKSPIRSDSILSFTNQNPDLFKEVIDHKRYLND